MLKFPLPGFTDFVKKNGENVAINFFQFKMDGDGKKLLKTVIPTFISFIWTKVKNVHSKTSRNVVSTRLQSIDGWKRLKEMEIVIGKKVLDEIERKGPCHKWKWTK